MKENIIVVGHTGIGLVGRAIAHLLPDDVIVVDVNNINKDQLPFPKSEPFILHNIYPVEMITGKGQFKCKGKHQYRLVDTIKKEMGNGSFLTEIWKCQCGKVLGS